MTQLGAKDLEQVVGFVRQAQATDELDAFRAELVPGLRRLVACDRLGWNEIDLEQGTAFTVSDAPAFDGVDRRFLELAHQHPMVPLQRRGELSARLISDFLDARGFHRLELYQDIYRPLGVEDQLALGLTGETIVAINLSREARTFTERDRRIIELVRPHLTLAYRRARERARISALMRALDADLESRHAGVVQLDAAGRIAEITSCARELLHAYLDEAPTDGHPLPRRICGWLHGARGDERVQALTIDGPRGRLRIRLHGDAGGDWPALILEEQRPTPPTTEQLRSLGLTDRQTQILRLLACGKRTRQIATELEISPATVAKHLEHVYAALGVTGRAEALARIYAL